MEVLPEVPMRRAIALTFVATMATSLLTAATPPELFAKAKEQFRLASYAGALKTLEELDSLSQQPGYEKDRTAILPGLAFYRGACKPLTTGQDADDVLQRDTQALDTLERAKANLRPAGMASG